MKLYVKQGGRIIFAENTIMREVAPREEDMKEKELVLKSTDTQYEMEEKLKPWLGRLSGDMYAFLVESLQAAEDSIKVEKDPFEKLSEKIKEDIYCTAPIYTTSGTTGTWSSHFYPTDSTAKVIIDTYDKEKS